MDTDYRIVAYQEENPELQARLLASLRACEWRAGALLADFLTDHPFFEAWDRAYFLLDGEVVVSYLTLSRQDCVDDPALAPWIGFVYTAPAYRGKRNAGALIRRALRRAADTGFKRVYVATDHIGVYEKYGFVYLENRLDRNGEDSRIYVYDL